MPHFEVIDQDGNTVTSNDLLGRKTIIYFYPKDNTSGCTAEACNLRDNYEALVAKGYNVIGVSKDSVKSHKNFKEKHSLPFTLLADTATDMIKSFGFKTKGTKWNWDPDDPKKDKGIDDMLLSKKNENI